MTEPRDEITTDAVPPDDLTLEPPAEPDAPDLPEPDPTAHVDHEGDPE